MNNKTSEKEMVKDSIESAEVKPYKTKELAKLYNMSTSTFRRNIGGIKNKLGKRKGYFYSIEQVQMIFEHMCTPFKVVTLSTDSNEPSKAA